MVKNSLFFQFNCSFDFGKKKLSLSILIWLQGRQIYPSIALQPKYTNNNRNKKKLLWFEASCFGSYPLLKPTKSR